MAPIRSNLLTQIFDLHVNQTSNGAHPVRPRISLEIRHGVEV